MLIERASTIGREQQYKTGYAEIKNKITSEIIA